jgi:CO/xanthine dehydrogenase FAD-binding subunit
VIPALGAYYRPDRLEEALGLLAAEPGYAVLAGGTDLLLEPQPRPGLVDISRLGLDRIEATPEGLSLGATVRIEDLLESPLAARWADGVLVGAALEFGTLQVRNMATVGGNIAHGLPAADLVPVLLALDAEVETAQLAADGKTERRRRPLQGFTTGPFATVLAPGELITAVHLPAHTRTWRAQYRKVGRVMKDLAQVNAVVALEITGRVRAARVVLGAVHPVVVRVVAAEGHLVQCDAGRRQLGREPAACSGRGGRFRAADHRSAWQRGLAPATWPACSRRVAPTTVRILVARDACRASRTGRRIASGSKRERDHERGACRRTIERRGRERPASHRHGEHGAGAAGAERPRPRPRSRSARFASRRVAHAGCAVPSASARRRLRRLCGAARRRAGRQLLDAGTAGRMLPRSTRSKVCPKRRRCTPAERVLEASPRRSAASAFPA